MWHWAGRLANEFQITTHVGVTSLTSAFLAIPSVGLTLVWTVDEQNLFSAYEHTQLALEELRLPTSIVAWAAEVYLTRMLEV